MTWYLITYDLARQALKGEPQEFSDADVAVKQYAKQEARYEDANVEVVLLAARSMSDLRVTHSRYFGKPAGPELVLG